MTTLIPVSVAVNDPDNGNFAGRCIRVDYNDMELYHDDWLRGCAFTYLENNRVRVSRRTFLVRATKSWYGNWCWDALYMTRCEARRLIRYLRETGKWHCEAGPSRLYDWFNSGAPA